MKQMLDQRFAVSVQIMTTLAFHGCREGHLMTSEQLAGIVRTNATVVRRLVARLVEAELLKAYKGKTGGIELARCPDEITLKDIYVAASEDKALFHSPNKAPRKSCAVSCAMGSLLKSVFDGVEDTSRNYLAGIRLADLARKVSGSEKLPSKPVPVRER